MTSVVRGGVLLLPVLGIFSYSIIHFNCRASQQVQNFKFESEEILRKTFLETVNGLRHTRAFGKKHRHLAQTFEIINRSQKCSYAELCRQGCAMFLCDLVTALTVAMLVLLAAYDPSPSSQSAIGFSIWSSSYLSHVLECLALEFARCEHFLMSAFHLQDMIRNIPLENHAAGNDVPPSWPERGEVMFDNVTARYK